MKHKWHKEIKAWADGADIESKFSYLSDKDDPEWYVDRFPDWNNDDIKFRIKSQAKESPPKTFKYLYVFKEFGDKIVVSEQNYGFEKIGIPLGKIKLEKFNAN
jgi:hypothetical protein